MLAKGSFLGRNIQSLLVSFGLISASSFLVYASHGYIESHFHYFVLIPFLALYQAWPPFLLAICYVGLIHSVIGVVWPHYFYNHTSALAHHGNGDSFMPDFLVYCASGLCPVAGP